MAPDPEPSQPAPEEAEEALEIVRELLDTLIARVPPAARP